MSHPIRRAALVAACAVAALATGAAAQPLRVLVTNDDGMGAPGIDALVEVLRNNPALEVHVSAPATNQSGTGENLSTGPITVTDATTASGYPAKSVAGFPVDAVLYGILTAMASSPPELVVSGINAGQNIAELSRISGTVGAALAAARRGIPAIATSQGLAASIDYAEQAQYVHRLVERFRLDKGNLREHLRVKGLPKGTPPRALVLNVNFPTCTTGAVRGVRVVPLGRIQVPASYTLLSSTGGVDTVQLVQTNNGFGSNDCTSTLETPLDDVQALSNGFAAVTPLATDFTAAGLLKKFKSLRE